MKSEIRCCSAARRASPQGTVLYRVPLSPTQEAARPLLVNAALAPFQTSEGTQAGWILVLEDVTGDLFLIATGIAVTGLVLSLFLLGWYAAAAVLRSTCSASAMSRSICSTRACVSAASSSIVDSRSSRACATSSAMRTELEGMAG